MTLDRRHFLASLAGAGAASVLLPRYGFAVSDDAWSTVYPEILRAIKAPKFPKRDFGITDYGAKADLSHDSTPAIAAAIAACSEAGGGRVVVPAGQFSTGAIHLKSNVDLHLSSGATLKFSADTKKYPVVETRWEGMQLMSFSAFIYANGQENIAITGDGTLDGGADREHWWLWHGSADTGWKQGMPNQKDARAKLYKMMQDGVPVAERVFGEDSYLRPNFIQPYKCKNILVEGVTVVNSPMWEIHPLMSENVTVRGVSISSHGPNNDGCDPESCKNVLIENCTFDTGDDCIAIKSGRNEDGRRVGVATENLIVRGCTMKDGHGGVTIGSEISGGVRNVFAERCGMDSPHLDHALRVKNNAARGGLLENFYFRDIEIGQVKHAVVTIDFNYEEGAKGKFKPVMRGFNVERVTSAKSEYGVDIQGLDGAPVENVSITDSSFSQVASGNIAKDLNGQSLKNFRINGKVVTKL
jgi:polygalacturonase